MSGLGLIFLRRGGQAHPTAGSDYILSENRGDPEVFRILMSKGVSSDGVGITKDDAAKVTTISNWFTGNTIIENFYEFQYFTGVTTLGASNSSTYGAFRNCTNLKSLVIPSSVSKIYRASLYNCTALVNLSVSWENIITLETEALFNCNSLNVDYMNLVNCTSLGENALYGVNVKKLNLKSLPTLPNAGSNQRQNYGSKTILESLVWSDAITSIPQFSLWNYSSLKSLRIPSLVTSIGRQAMYTCTGLSHIMCEAVTPPTLGDNTVFDNTGNCPIYVPDASVDAYKAANYWTEYASRIKPISEL